MRKISLLVFLLVAATVVCAQVPDQFAFQGIARDATNKPVANQSVSVRFTLHQGSESGAPVYQEIHSTQTAASGVFNISVGAGSVSSGSFAAIDWAAGPYFLQVELDVAGGSNYATMSTAQLQSVPYALTARTLGGAASPQEGDVLVYRGSQWQRKPGKGFFQVVGPGASPGSGLASISFLSTPAVVTVAASNPVIKITAMKEFGSNAAGGGIGLKLALGYRRTDIPNQPLTIFTPNNVEPSGYLRIAIGSRVPMFLTGIYMPEMSAGTYEMGLVGYAGSDQTAATWNSNGYSSTSVEIEY